MSQDIFENNPPIHLFRRRRTRRLRLSINSSGEVVATRPWFVSERLAKEFVRQQRD